MVRIVKGAYHVLSQVSHLEHDRGNATTKITPPARASCYRCHLPSVESELPVVTVTQSQSQSHSHSHSHSARSQSQSQSLPAGT